MPIPELFFARRSVRKFNSRTVSRETVEELLAAAMSAPSACAKDPWQFLVTAAPESLAKIAEGLPNGKFLATAPVGIVVCGDIESAHGTELSYMLQDCSAAIENLLLAAASLKLGACWLGVHPRQERIDYLRGLLRLPEHLIPVGVIALGYPVTEPEPRNRFNPEKARWLEAASPVVAVLGASAKADRYSNQAVRELLAHNFKVIAVSNSPEPAHGLTPVQSLEEISERVHSISVYLNPGRSTPLGREIIALKPVRVIFNPGAENPELSDLCRQNGIEAVNACTLVMLRSGMF